MAHSGGKWKIGKSGTVVTDIVPDWYKGQTGHDDQEYYGGFLLAESIAHDDDARIMAASPLMLKALKLWQAANALGDAAMLAEARIIRDTAIREAEI